MRVMDYAQIKTHYGSANKAALALGVSRQAVYRWRQTGVPLDKQFIIEQLTNGALKAERIAA